jgi:hypothetical protein
MTPDQTKMILAKAALIDNRIIDIHVIKAWHEVIGRFDYEDAIAALTLHRQNSTEYLLPAHIKDNIRSAKLMRASNEARQRAIEVTRARELLAAQGEEATPVRLQELREQFENLGRMERPALVAEIVEDETERPPLNLYERLKASAPQSPAA